jgi:hypothetical protein
MIPTIYVFEPQWVKPWEDAGYQIFYDHLHGNDEEWLKRQLKGDYLLVNTDGERFINFIGDGPFRYFVLFSEPIPTEWWEEVQPGPVSWFDRPEVLKAENGVESISQPPEYEQIKEPYEFEMQYCDPRDTMLYSVRRPGTDEPYTVVVEQWTKKGHEAFFTDIYGARSWDQNRTNCRFDFTFLQKIWKHLQLPGEFSIQLVKEKIERCYPRPGQVPEPEPVVYRRPIREVLQRLARRDGGQ